MTDAQPKKHRLPATFRSLGTLRVLNVLALASALGGGTGAVFGNLFGGTGDRSAMAATTISTFLVALVWARAMRSRRTFFDTKLRSGWAWSVPLAALNGAMACGLLAASENGNFIEGFILGGTIGAILWVPGLLAVLALYAYPIARAQSLAEKGLAGEERGERFVGVVSLLIALATFVVVPARRTFMNSVFGEVGLLVELGRPLVLGAATIAALSGLTAAVLATYRDRVRRAFVRDVEAGTIEGLRVDTTGEGKVLVRVTSHGAGYRASTLEEQIYGLDEGGDARRALTGEEP
ncbi:MAG: hypothetical protein KIT84_32355 [Labilithrix sp.]|nr:hypothetical protein [Labilithrix sp.]MCW5815766.1 hypothetical protein [Labilithrix sp.]